MTDDSDSPAAHERLAGIHFDALDAVGARRHGERALAGFDGAARLLILFRYLADYLGVLEYGVPWLEAHPDDIDALIHLGRAFYMLGRYDEALGMFARAARHAPLRLDATFSLGETLMLLGDVEAGWRRFDDLANEGLLQTISAEVRPSMTRFWRGETLTGKRIFVVHFLGIGDNIMMARYARLLKQAGAHVAFCCRPEVFRLFEKLEGVDELSDDWRLPGWADFDYWTFDYLLPRHMAGTPRVIPAFEAGYIAAPSRAAPLIAPAIPGRLRVGLCWSSGPGHFTGLARFLTPEDLRPLADLAGIDWFVVQKGLGNAGFAERSGLAALDFSKEWADFRDAAAFMAELDLIISICSGPLHLAGALGLPAWGLICAAPDWRWGTTGSRSAWYPNIRLFRQAKLYDWGPVVEEIKAALEGYEGPAVVSGSK